MESATELTPESFPTDLFADEPSMAVLTIDDSLTLGDARRKAVEDFERQYLKSLLTRQQGRIKRAAEEAAISSRQLHKLMTKYGLRKEEFKP